MIFWDTSKRPVYDDRLLPDHEAQPYIVQLAAQLAMKMESPSPDSR